MLHLLLRLLASLKSWIYDTLIIAMTTVWYREVLVRLPTNATVLDVGIGTATALIDNRDILISKNLRFLGVDYDALYIETATEAVQRHRLTPFIDLSCCSIHDFDPKTSRTNNKRSSSAGSKAKGDQPVHHQFDSFDAIYYSGSFMIIPDKVKALQRTVAFLKPSSDSKIYFTQTFETPGLVGFAMTFIKPFLKYLLSIDFGSVTYEGDFREVLRAAEVTIQEIHVIQKSAFRRQVLVVAIPAPHHVMHMAGLRDEPHPQTWSELVAASRKKKSQHHHASSGSPPAAKASPSPPRGKDADVEGDPSAREADAYNSHWF